MKNVYTHAYDRDTSRAVKRTASCSSKNALAMQKKNGKWAKIMVIPKIFYRFMIEIIFLFCYYKIKLYLCSVIKDPLCPYGHLPLYGENLQSAVDIKGTDTKANTISNDSMAFLIVILNSFQDLWADKDK